VNSRLLSVIRKEFIHILRDPRTLGMMIVMPVVELILLGYTATTDIRHLSTAVYDGDRSPQSRQLIDAYNASDYFQIKYYVPNEGEMATLLDRGTIRAGLIIPAGYGDEVVKGTVAQVAFVIDGSDPAVATTAFGASQSVGQALNTRIIQQRLGLDVTNLGGLEVRPRVWYNPGLRSANYMIPALIGLILQFLLIIFTAQTIVREREQGTIEQLVVTPIKPWELVVGKLVPYVIIAFWDLAEVLLIGVVWFDVPMRGSLVLLAGEALLFLSTTLGLGLFISTISKTQQEAFLIAMMINLPGIFLSGFFFPLEAMPPLFQAISYLIPLRYMLIILRGIVVKGVGLDSFGDQTVALAVFAVLIMGAAMLRFRKSLE
jgi:drug efflux transport system permease protein